MARVLLALAALCLAGLAVASGSGRLVEKEIDLPVHRAPGPLGDTPLVDPPKRIAGYFKLNRTHDAHMFYFYFQSRSKPATDPVVLWMTGGPGCSSEIAIFYENGPYTINKDMTLNETLFGWDVHHNMIFVDQPVNVGFSYSKDSRDRVYDEKLVADDMLDFLWEFFQAHPEVADNDFYVTGESYAGHYVPAVSYRVYRSNELGHGPYINLKGLAVGNGLTDPAIQFPAYAEYAMQNKLISKQLHDSIGWWMPLCVWGSNFCNSHNWRFACIIALEYCQITGFERILAANPGINVYDITKKCVGALCYDMSAAEEFLNKPDVRKALGVPENREWVSCDMDVHADMMGDWLRAYDWMLKPMLEDDIQVMIYAGDLDLICNWVGNQMWVDVLEWEGGEAWADVAPEEWAVAGAAAGTVRELGPLSFVRVYQAGHMVPMDQPKNALTMLTKWTRGKSLVTSQPRSTYTQAVLGQQQSGQRLGSVAVSRGRPGQEDEQQQRSHSGQQAASSWWIKQVLGRQDMHPLRPDA